MSAAPINLSELRKQATLASHEYGATVDASKLLALVEAVEAAHAYVHWQDTRRIGPAYLRLVKALARFAIAATPT